METTTLLKLSVLIGLPFALHIGLTGGNPIKNRLGDRGSRLAAIPVSAFYVFDIFFGLMLYGTGLSWLTGSVYFYPFAFISFLCAVLHLTILISNPLPRNDKSNTR